MAQTAKGNASSETTQNQMKFCQGCGKKVHTTAKSCPNCGFVFKKANHPAHTNAIIGLFLNIIVLPGLGTIIGGETKKGIWQMVLVFINFLLIIPIILNPEYILLIILIILIFIGIWIWALVTSIMQIQNSE